MSRSVRSLSAARATRRLPPTPRTSLRTVLGRFATGVTVITVGGEHAHGTTANAFSSISLDPPLIMVCLARTSRLHFALREAGTFAVSILGDRSEPVARHFADWRRPEGMAQFAGIGHRIGSSTGAPVLDDALAWLECRLTAEHDGGDHSIFVGEVLACDVVADHGGADGGDAALAFFCGTYHRIGPHRLARSPAGRGDRAATGDTTGDTTGDAATDSRAG